MLLHILFAPGTIGSQTYPLIELLVNLLRHSCLIPVKASCLTSGLVSPSILYLEYSTSQNLPKW